MRLPSISIHTKRCAGLICLCVGNTSIHLLPRKGYRYWGVDSGEEEYDLTFLMWSFGFGRWLLICRIRG